MRLLVVNPNTTASMTAKIGAAATPRRLARHRDRRGQSRRSGPASIEGYYDEAFSVPGLLAEIAQGRRRRRRRRRLLRRHRPRRRALPDRGAGRRHRRGGLPHCGLDLAEQVLGRHHALPLGPGDRAQPRPLRPRAPLRPRPRLRRPGARPREGRPRRRAHRSPREIAPRHRRGPRRGDRARLRRHDRPRRLLRRRVRPAGPRRRRLRRRHRRRHGPHRPHDHPPRRLRRRRSRSRWPEHGRAGPPRRGRGEAGLAPGIGGSLACAALAAAATCCGRCRRRTGPRATCSASPASRCCPTPTASPGTHSPSTAARGGSRRTTRRRSTTSTAPGGSGPGRSTRRLPRPRRGASRSTNRALRLPRRAALRARRRRADVDHGAGEPRGPPRAPFGFGLHPWFVRDPDVTLRLPARGLLPRGAGARRGRPDHAAAGARLRRRRAAAGAGGTTTMAAGTGRPRSPGPRAALRLGVDRGAGLRAPDVLRRPGQPGLLRRAAEQRLGRLQPGRRLRRSGRGGSASSSPGERMTGTVRFEPGAVFVGKPGEAD